EAVMLDHGAIASSGEPEEVVRHIRLHLLKEDLAYATDEGSREIEIVSASLIREDGGDGQKVMSGQTLTIQIDLKATHAVDDPVISFALHDQDNRFIYGTNTDWMGLHFHPFEGKRRLRFHLRNLPFVRGKFWVTLGVHSKDASVVYHVQEQRYSFEVEHGAENPGEVVGSPRPAAPAAGDPRPRGRRTRPLAPRLRPAAPRVRPRNALVPYERRARLPRARLPDPSEGPDRSARGSGRGRLDLSER